MNEVTTEKKDNLTKTMAIVGFVAVIILIVWLSVQIVQFIPNAFSSLASIANGVYGSTQNELIVANETTVANANEPFVISWSTVANEGTYSFSYECTDGVAIALSNGTAIACDTPLVLEDHTSVNIIITSEKERFADVSYTVTYTSEDAEKTKSTSSVLTVMNDSIPASDTVDPEPEGDAESETPGVVAGESTDTPTQGTPTTVEEVIYQIPVSDPNGEVDLQVRHLGVGILNGKTFIPKSSIDVDEKGAIQFEIKNIGTKTASKWEYEVNLPSDITYTADDQEPLKPNERVVITVGFEGIGRTGTERVGAEVDARDDVNASNDDYTWSVKVVD